MLMNENYSYLDMLVGVEGDIIKGFYWFKEVKCSGKKYVMLMGFGIILV